MTTAAHLDAFRTALLKLTPVQQMAVEALVAGATQQQAAEAAGVTRATVTRWAGHVPAFKASMNLYRATVVEEQVGVSRRIRGKALKAVEAALDERIDPLAVLRGVSADPGSVGPTVPETVLDAEMGKTRAGLLPSPPAQGLDALVESLANPGPSDIERAVEATLTRLTVAGLSGGAPTS